MITTDEVISAYPQAAGFDVDMLNHWIDVANVAVPIGRVKDMKTHPMTQVLFVMHHMVKPPLDLEARYVRAQMASPHPAVKKAHPWSGTIYGDSLRKAVRY